MCEYPSHVFRKTFYGFLRTAPGSRFFFCENTPAPGIPGCELCFGSEVSCWCNPFNRCSTNLVQWLNGFAIPIAIGWICGPAAAAALPCCCCPHFLRDYLLFIGFFFDICCSLRLNFLHDLKERGSGV